MGHSFKNKRLPFNMYILYVLTCQLLQNGISSALSNKMDNAELSVTRAKSFILKLSQLLALTDLCMVCMKLVHCTKCIFIHTLVELNMLQHISILFILYFINSLYAIPGCKIREQHESCLLKALDLSLIHADIQCLFVCFNHVQDAKLSALCDMGSKDVPLEDKTLTVVYGSEIVSLNFTNFCGTSEKVAQVSTILHPSTSHQSEIQSCLCLPD